MVSQSTIQPLMPQTPGLLAHCRRVAALAQAVAHHLFLMTEEKDRLEAACLLHHFDLALMFGGGFDKLLADLYGAGANARGLSLLPGDVFRVLYAFLVPGSGDAADRRLAEILRLADAFDQGYEFSPLEAKDPTALLPTLRSGVEEGLWSREYLEALDLATQLVPLPAATNWKIPTFPKAAVRVIELLQRPRASLNQVEEAAGLDPGIAGHVMQLANSALFGSRASVVNLRDAVARLGFETSHKVVSSVALRAVLTLPSIEPLWPHSLDTADMACQLAGRSGLVDSGQAYLCGLLHDVGRIALEAVPLYDSARLCGFIRAGCPRVYAENLLLRTDHGALGAHIAQFWRLPDQLVEAVKHHHRPEAVENPLASCLYLAEFLSGGEEDLPSRYRFHVALRRLNLKESEVLSCQTSAVCRWLAA